MKHKIFFLLFCIICINVSHSQVKIEEDNTTVTLSNKYAQFTFDKNSADLKAIQYLNYSNLLGKKGSAYLSGPNWTMNNSKFSITKKTNNLIDISFFKQGGNHFSYDLHYVIKADIKGIYVYLVETHHSQDSAGIYEQTRWGLRADPNLFNYHLVRDSIQGPMYAMDSLESGEKLQDWTYKMKNGTIYTKYDYADYINNRNVHGMAGTNSHLGIFVIQASHEYLNGGPTKQYMTVHSNPYLICMFNCSHFLNTNRVADDTIKDNWSKLNGPFLLYIDKENSVSKLWRNAKNTAKKQEHEWPYTWLENKDYPLQRGSITIHSKDENNQPLANVTFVLADSGYDWQAQSRNYIYWNSSDKNGTTQIKNIRPGKYTLYACGGNRLIELKENSIYIKENNSSKLNITFPSEDKNIIWQIGQADRTTQGFKYSDHKRAYGLFDSVPENLNFTIGKREDSDWYYAQTKVGSWNIFFKNNVNILNDSITLYITLAGVAKNPSAEILLNGQRIGKLNNLGNDRSIYRSAVLGGYYLKKQFRFSKSLLKKENILTFKMDKCPRGGGFMYDAIRLSNE